jgi:LPXTG-motif cell wall-anchored protein
VVLAGAVAGLIGFAGTASAHKPAVSAECKDGSATLTVTLVAYNSDKKNTVKVTDNGTVLDETQFKDHYTPAPFKKPGDVKHTFTVVVLAGDDLDGKQGFSFTDTKVVEACVTPPTSTKPTTPPPSSSTTPPPSSTTSSSSVAAPVIATSTTTPAPQAAPALAETGASIAIPLGIGGVLLVGGAALLFVVRRRSKA